MKSSTSLEELEEIDYDSPVPPLASHNAAHAAFWKKQLVKHLFAVAFGRARAEGVDVSLAGGKGLLNQGRLILHHEDAD